MVYIYTYYTKIAGRNAPFLLSNPQLILFVPLAIPSVPHSTTILPTFPFLSCPFLLPISGGWMGGAAGLIQKHLDMATT